MNNYDLISEKYIDEIESDVKIYKHKKSGARICVMANEDENKVFSIAFRTPPINNCGLTHILEHSVLCGSKKYPVKDPFVCLLKGSLNTFLNAFTFPDKTMYPCASLNDKDFKNLMSVYMDAVFYPAIYQHQEIFLQEGWHYEINDVKDPIVYNGVVYNEMKGAFSNPEETLGRHIMHSLFPTNAYGLESGGDPDYIPELDYKEFLNFHKKYYSPSNSYIYIYGNCDMEERLEWLDKEYLSKFDIVDFDTTLKPEHEFKAPVSVTEYYEAEGDLKNKTFLSYNTAFPTVLDQKLVTAASILVNSLFNIPGAKLKEKIQAAGIGSDVSAMFEPEVFNPYLSIEVSEANPEDEEKLKTIIDDYLKDLLKNGVDKASILSLINHTEFENRERNFSSRMPKGLMIEIAGLTTWLYDDNAPYAALESLNIYKELKEDLNNGYFEMIIDKYILNNNHKSFVTLEPKVGYQQEKTEAMVKKLEDYKKSLTEEELKALVEMNKRLKEYQSSGDTEEALNSLPKLALSDIDENPYEYKIEEKKDEFKTLHCPYHTNGITYLRYFFDISHIDLEDLKTLTLYLALVTQMNTNKHTYFEINQEILNEYGSLNGTTITGTKADLTRVCHAEFSLSCLDEKTEKANDLLMNVMFDTDFSDTKRIYQRLGEIKSNLEMGIVGMGHRVALFRALSFIDEQYAMNDVTSGIGYLDYIEDLYKNFDSKKDELVKALNNVKNFFGKDNLRVAVTGNEETYQNALKSIQKMTERLNEKASFKTFKFVPNPHKEAIKAPFNVNFVSRVGNYQDTYTGASMTLENCLSMDFLWQNVRVLGGAYGCMMSVSPQGVIGFTSYRDPNVDRTYNTYADIVDFIDNLDPAEDELLGFKIGAIGNTQLVEHVKAKSQTAILLYLKDITFDYRKKNRTELLHATKDDFKRMVSWYKDVFANASSCVLGSAKGIEESKIPFDVVRNLTD